MKKTIFKILSTLVFAFLYYYFLLPPINIHSFAFWMFIIFVVGFYLLASVCVLSINELETIINKRKVHNKVNSKAIIISFCSIFVIFFLIFLINIICSPLFMSKSYYERINIETGDFSKDIPVVDFDKLALLDKDSSQKLGDRVMGQMTDLVSQFDVSNLYTQINYKNTIVRVTPLEYSGLIKYFTNRKNGVAGYITVNSVNGEANLVRLDKGMKYVPSALFGEDLYRKLRFSYPTEIFGDISFEIDEEGNPYWIAQTIEYTAVGLKKEVSGVIVLNPIDGTSVKYDSVNSLPQHIAYMVLGCSGDINSKPVILLDQNNIIPWGKGQATVLVNGNSLTVYSPYGNSTVTSGMCLSSDNVRIFAGKYVEGSSGSSNNNGGGKNVNGTTSLFIIFALFFVFLVI